MLNRAAGLDTRPYRMDLPTDLLWIEADLAAPVAEKDALLADQSPRCRLKRYGVDLSDADERAAFLDEALAGASKALVLTEGLVMYLDDADIAALSDSLHRPDIYWWVLDFASPGLLIRQSR